jgi:hypothetical protein
VVSSVINAGGGNVEDFNISPSTAWRQARQSRKEIADEIRENWIQPLFPIVHWDEKFIT